jgi:hypothetical protein
MLGKKVGMKKLRENVLVYHMCLKEKRKKKLNSCPNAQSLCLIHHPNELQCQTLIWPQFKL